MQTKSSDQGALTNATKMLIIFSVRQIALSCAKNQDRISFIHLTQLKIKNKLGICIVKNMLIVASCGNLKLSQP